MMTGEESSKLHLESSLRKRNPPKTCVSVKVTWTKSHSNFPSFFSKFKNILLKNIFLPVFFFFFLSTKAYMEVRIPSSKWDPILPIDVFITCKCCLLLGWNHTGKWRLHDKGGKKKINTWAPTMCWVCMHTLNRWF